VPRLTTLILIIVLALVGVGTLMVYSVLAVKVGGGGLIQRHLFFVGAGLVGLFVMRHLDYHFLSEPQITRLIMFVALLLLVLVFVPKIGVERNGAQRWIRVVGFQFQPSEFAKLALIVMLALKLSENQDRIKSFWKGFVPPLILAGLFSALVLLERDLGMPVVLMSTALLMIFVAGARWFYVAGSFILAGAGVAALILTSPYRLGRLMAFLDPWSNRDEEGYHLIQSLAAFARGGVYGVGVGASQQKLTYLPAAHTDFIFAVWAEEAGLVGTLALVVFFVGLLILGAYTAVYARDLFGSLLAVGITSLITIQGALNMAVTTGMAPTKGLPLPFISYGGSALLVFLALAGILLNVSLQAQKPEKESGVRR